MEHMPDIKSGNAVDALDGNQIILDHVYDRYDPTRSRW
jgi:hypothetical protein